MNQKSLVPPKFAIAASSFLYDPDLPDHLYRTYARITGLAWQKRLDTGRTYEKTPPLTVYELALVCNLSVRNVWRHIKELGERELLTWEVQKGVQTRMVFYPVWPGPAADVVDPFAPPTEPADRATGGAPADPTLLDSEAAAETYEALAEFGVNILGSLARQVAALSHVTPGLVRAWGASLQQRPGIHNLPGLLLHILQRHTEPPPETRPSPPSSATQAPLLEPASAPALPDGLEQALQNLGWSGDDAWAEAAQVAARDPDFVWAWVRYVEAHPNLGAGFLRAQLRGATWPSTKKDAQERERERWREQWLSQGDGDQPLRRAPSPQQEAMERYGIAPETMQVWEQAQTELALQMTRATFDTWLRNALLLSADDGRATIGVRQARAVEWLQHRLDKVVKRTLARCLDRPVAELTVVLLPEVEGKAEG